MLPYLAVAEHVGGRRQAAGIAAHVSSEMKPLRPLPRKACKGDQHPANKKPALAPGGGGRGGEAVHPAPGVL